MERRTFRRIKVDAEITLNNKYGIYNGVLDNISMGGLFARTRKRMSMVAGDTTEIIIQFPVGTRKDSIVINGMVTRVNRNGVAFKFLDIK